MIINFWICQTHPGHFKRLSAFELEFQDNIRPPQTKTAVRGRSIRSHIHVDQNFSSDCPTHGRIRTTEDYKYQNVDGGGRMDECPSVEAWITQWVMIELKIPVWTKMLKNYWKITGVKLTKFFYFCFSLVSLQNSWFTTGSTLECDFLGLLRLSETIISACTAYTY